MSPFGYWRVDDGPITTRRFLFVVHGGAGVLETFRPIATERGREFVVGALRYEDFHAEEPDVEVEVPAVLILNRRKERFAIVQNVRTAQEFGRVLERVIKGELEAEAKIRMPRLFPRLVDGPTEQKVEMEKKGSGRGWVWAVRGGGGIVVVVMIGLVVGRRVESKKE
jgi:hypothetical protein